MHRTRCVRACNPERNYRIDRRLERTVDANRVVAACALCSLSSLSWRSASCAVPAEFAGGVRSQPPTCDACAEVVADRPIISRRWTMSVRRQRANAPPGSASATSAAHARCRRGPPALCRAPARRPHEIRGVDCTRAAINGHHAPPALAPIAARTTLADFAACPSARSTAPGNRSSPGAAACQLDVRCQLRATRSTACSARLRYVVSLPPMIETRPARRGQYAS